MRTNLLLLLLTAFCVSCHSQQPPPNFTSIGSVNESHPQPFTSISTVNKSRWATLRICDFEKTAYFFQAPRDAVENEPKWDLESEFPLLSPRRAEAAARSKARQMRPDIAKWNLDQISLFQWGDTSWYYLVRLNGEAISTLRDVPISWKCRSS